MHSLLVECLLRAWPHVKDTVKVLSSSLESDEFWGDCQRRSDHPREAWGNLNLKEALNLSWGGSDKRH